MTPNDVKQKRKVSADDAASAGASCGTVTSRARRSGPAPSTAAASALRGSSPAQAPPTIRTTTATLKKTCAARIAGSPLSTSSGSSSRKAVATTTVGSTNGTRTSARVSERPRNRNRPITQASGSPATSVSAVESAACQVVNQTSAGVPSGRDGPPSEVSPRSRIVTSGKTKKSARNATGTSAAVGRFQRRTTCVHSPIQRSRLRPISAAVSSSGRAGETA